MIEMISRQYLEKAGGNARRTSSTSEDPRPATAMTLRPISAITTAVEEDVFDSNLKEKQSDPPKCKFIIFSDRQRSCAKVMLSA